MDVRVKRLADAFDFLDVQSVEHPLEFGPDHFHALFQHGDVRRRFDGGHAHGEIVIDGQKVADGGAAGLVAGFHEFAGHAFAVVVELSQLAEILVLQLR